MDSRIRLHEGRLFAGGRGWVPASARTTGGGGMGEREERVALGGGGMGSPHPSSRGLSVGGQRKGKRGRGGVFTEVGTPRERWDGRERGKGWVPAYASSTGGMGSRIRLHGGLGEKLGGRTRGGRVFAGTTGRGAEMHHPRGQGGEGWEDTGGCPILTFPPGGWIPALGKEGDGDGFPHPNFRGNERDGKERGVGVPSVFTEVGGDGREGGGWVPAYRFGGGGFRN